MRMLNVKVAPIKHKENTLTEVMQNSNDEVIAKAIQDMLSRDKIEEEKPKKTKKDKDEQNKQQSENE
jgi:ribosomal protein L13